MSHDMKNTDDRLEPAPWDAWVRDVLREYQIPFDNTIQGLRAALCMWMADHNQVKQERKCTCGQGYDPFCPWEAYHESVGNGYRRLVSNDVLQIGDELKWPLRIVLVGLIVICAT